MNKYVTDYDTCLATMIKPIELSSAFETSNGGNKGKELWYDTTTLKFKVIEYNLLPKCLTDVSNANVKEYYYSDARDLFYYKELESEEEIYDLSDAIEIYNSIEIDNALG